MFAPGSRAGGKQITGAQNDAPYFIVRVFKGKAHLLVLGEFRMVASWYNIFALVCHNARSKCHTSRPRRFCSRETSEVRMAESAVLSPNRRALEVITNCSVQLYSTRCTKNGDSVRWKKDDVGYQKNMISSLTYVSDGLWSSYESSSGMIKEPYGMLFGNGGGDDRPRPFRIVANQTGIGLARTREGTVPRTQFSCGIGAMQRCWGL